MGIYKVKGSPHYHFAFTIKGNRYRGSTRSHKKSEAETIYAAERRKILLGEIETPSISLEEAFIKYEEEHAMFLTSYEAVQAHVNSLLAYFGKNKPVHDIGQNELEKFVAFCRSQTYTRKEGGREFQVSNATINRRISAFQGMHSKASKSWKVRVQPIDFKALKLKERTVINNTLPRDQLKALHDAAPPHLQRFIMVSIYTGWRKANVLSLRGSQIDLDRKIVTTIGKGGKSIITHITDSFEEYILQHDLHNADLVCSYNEQPIRDIKVAWRALFKRSGLPYIRPHDLRHTFGTWLYESTGDQRLVQEALHHSDIKTSMRYTHTRGEIQRKRISDAMRISAPKLPKLVKQGKKRA